MYLLKFTMVFCRYLGGYVWCMHNDRLRLKGWISLEGGVYWCTSFGRIGCSDGWSILAAACWIRSVWRSLQESNLDFQQFHGRQGVIICVVRGCCGKWCGVQSSIFGFGGVLVSPISATTSTRDVLNLVSSFVFFPLLFWLFLCLCLCTFSRPCTCTCCCCCLSLFYLLGGHPHCWWFLEWFLSCIGNVFWDEVH